MKTSPNNHVVYDLRVAPITFDFCTFLAIASLFMLANKMQFFDLSIRASAFRNITPREKTYSIKERIWRLNNLLLPVARQCTYIRNVQIVIDERSSVVPSNIAFPVGYQYDEPKTAPYATKIAIDLFARTGIAPSIFQASEEAVERLRVRFPRGTFLTLNPRVARFDSSRNSNLDEWYALYKTLKVSGNRVVVIPDQDDVLGAREFLRYDWEVFSEGSLSVDLRLAVWSLATQNVVSSGGIGALAVYSSIPYLICNLLNHDSPVANERYFADFVGISVGERYPWCSPEQNLFWHAFNVEEIARQLGFFTQV